MGDLAKVGGHLLSKGGHLFSAVNGCACCPGGGGGGGGTGCACSSFIDPCSFCTDAVPTQFHITITGVTLCASCTDCSATGTSFQMSGTINGDYILTQNGECAWSASTTITGTEYTSTGCTGTSILFSLDIDLTRISTTQFQLDINDAASNFAFRATITTTGCCVNFTASNSLTTCGCTSPTGFMTVGTGGTITGTKC